MTWADSVPNLLIGLREGLEAGLVVTILLAAVRKTATARADRGGEPQVSTAPIWLGVLGAVTLSGAFAAVLTFSVSVLSSAGQEAVGGLLSVFAVGLVTAMIFWMRRAAATLSAHLKGEVARAAAIGTGALTITAFLSVGREGLETTLFLWTAAKASGQTVGPLIGAAIGIALAITLCSLLYRRAIHLNVGAFFNRTALALIVIAAGVLAYGLGDLQDANWLPGHAWVAFDLSTHIDATSWWASIITGITELSPRMTVLQATAWLAYLVVVIPAFVHAGRAARAPVRPAAAVPAPVGLSRWERLAGGRPWAVASVLVVVPVLAAGVTIAAVPAAASSDANTVSVTKSACAPEFTAASTGSQTFTVSNTSGLAGEVDLDNAAGAVVGEIETLGPGTFAPLTATLGAGTYTFRCLMGSQPATASQAVQVAAGGTTVAAPVAVKPVTLSELAPPNVRYQQWAAAQLVTLAAAVKKLQGDLGQGDIAAAKQDWLPAMLDWERVGASYDSFGDLGQAVDGGLAGGMPKGVNDPGFTGLHRLEYGLWSGQPARELVPVAAALAENVAKVAKNLTSDALAGDPTQLPLRVHEIIEDALRDHLAGVDEYGAGAAYAMTYADTQVDRVVLGDEAALINARDPGLVATAERQLTTLDQALLATRASGGRWQSPTQVTLLPRQRVNAAIGALLETLAVVPDLLEIPPTH